MMKKLSVVVFFTVLFLTVGAFHYQGTKSVVTATNGESNPGAANVQNDNSADNENTKEASEDTEEEDTTTDENKPKTADSEVNSKTESGEDKTTDNTSSSTETPPAVENQTSENQNSPERDRVKLGDDEYVDISDMAKFKDMADMAAKHGARLYGIENSDCFAIIKNGDPLLFFSVGTASAGLQNISVLKDYFAGTQMIGIAGNIDLVAETGATVDVEFSEVSGYHISKKDNTILVNWADE